MYLSRSPGVTQRTWRDQSKEEFVLSGALRVLDEETLHIGVTPLSDGEKPLAERFTTGGSPRVPGEGWHVNNRCFSSAASSGSAHAAVFFARGQEVLHKEKWNPRGLHKSFNARVCVWGGGVTHRVRWPLWEH